MIDALEAHAFQECTAHLVSWSEISPWQVSDRTVSRGVHESSSFSTHGLGDQKTGSSGKLQSCGMKLNELKIFNRGPCSPGQGDALSCGLSWIGGVGVEVPSASSGEDHGSRSNPLQPAPVQNLDAAAVSVLHPELADANTPPMQQPRPLLGMLPKHIDQSMAGSVLDMQHTVMTVRSLEGCGQAPVAVPIEIHPQLEQPVDTVRCLFNEQTNSIAVAKTCAGVDGVCRMAAAVVIATSDGCDPALGPSAR